MRQLLLWVLVLAVIAVLLMHWLRTRQIAARFDARVEERVATSLRIAHEHHDSLLQGVQGLVFRLQAVREMLPHRAADAIRVLEDALDRADETILKAREAAGELRDAPVTPGDLAQSLTALAEELGARDRHAPGVRIMSSGTWHAIDPVVRDEIYRAAREALRNAFEHAQATNIEAEILYDKDVLTLRVRDDGKGMDQHALDSGGGPHHWGLSGMRERTSQFGGALEVWSKLGAGTEISVTIPVLAPGRSKNGPPT
jgi:signal transduction histidine kinase